MRNRFLGSLVGWFTAIALAVGQAPRAEVTSVTTKAQDDGPVVQKILSVRPRAITASSKQVASAAVAPPAPVGPSGPATYLPPVVPTQLGSSDEPPIELNAPRAVPPTSPEPRTPEPRALPTAPLLVPTPAVVPGPVTYGHPGRFWTRFEYLLWTTTNAPSSFPLVTTTGSSSSSSTPSVPTGGTDIPTTTPSTPSTPTPSTPAALGGPNTLTLVGGGGFDFGNYDGFRLSGGYWLDPEQTVGIEVSAFHVEPLSIRLTIPGTSQTSGVLSRPFIDGQTSNSSAFIIAQPSSAAGAVQVFAQSRLWGFEADSVGGLTRSGEGYLSDWMAGARVLDLTEEINIAQMSVAQAGGVFTFNGQPVNAPSGIGVADRFYTRNQFYGAQVGWRGECRWDPFFINLNTQLAVGWTHQTVNVFGNTLLVNGGSTAVTPGGLLALPTNMGRSSRDAFTAVPQVGVNVGFRCTDWLRFLVGYNLLYWSSVVRPGDQINPIVNQAQAPSSTQFGTYAGPNQPSPLFTQRDFWLQGLNFGMEMHF